MTDYVSQLLIPQCDINFFQKAPRLSDFFFISLNNVTSLLQSCLLQPLLLLSITHFLTASQEGFLVLKSLKKLQICTPLRSFSLRHFLLMSQVFLVSLEACMLTFISHPICKQSLYLQGQNVGFPLTCFYFLLSLFPLAFVIFFF